QNAVSLHAVTDTASVPLAWRLYLPKQWADPADERRARTGVPEAAWINEPNEQSAAEQHVPDLREAA
ncbi:transposase, partial [Nocardiopsis kunsanensis]|uniref:transposase n=1 Tax=Nocardiopsis kunsanensis TaxID=141693 RepID=UPI0023529FD2